MIKSYRHKFGRAHNNIVHHLVCYYYFLYYLYTRRAETSSIRAVRGYIHKYHIYLQVQMYS